MVLKDRSEIINNLTILHETKPDDTLSITNQQVYKNPKRLSSLRSTRVQGASLSLELPLKVIKGYS